MLAERMKLVGPSPTIAISSKAKEMKASGLPIIDLSAGDPALDPEYPTPESVKQAGIDAIQTGKTGYTSANGILPLREKIVEKLKKYNNINYSPEEITVGCGAKQILFNGFLATINQGDEVIIPVPSWVSYCDMVALCGGKPITILGLAENEFKVTAQQIAEKITIKTKWLILNSPCNPTGAIYTKQELSEIADVLMQNPHVHIMSDDIYEYLIYSAEDNFCHIINVEPKLQERVLIINGTAKSHGMTGWRVGFGAGNRQLISAMNILASQSTSNACTISQYATIAALEDGDQASKQTISALRNKRDLVVSTLSSVKGLNVINPKGAFYVFVGIKDLIGKSFRGEKINSCKHFCELLLNKNFVATIPGSAFFAPDNFRIALTASTENVKNGAIAIRQFVEEIS